MHFKREKQLLVSTPVLSIENVVYALCVWHVIDVDEHDWIWHDADPNETEFNEQFVLLEYLKNWDRLSVHLTNHLYFFIYLNPVPFIFTVVPPLIEPDLGANEETENW